MQARLPAGLLPKAERGEFALQRPTGLVRTGQGQVLKRPHPDAPARLSLVFETFLPCRSASKVVEVCNPPNLLRPRRARFGALVWQAPRGAAVLAMLKQPADAGAFTYGRSRTRRRAAPPARPSITRLPQEPWRICIPDVSPPSSSWETYLQIQTRRQDTHAEYDWPKTRGMPRPGKALWPGRVYCGACGHKMVVQSKGGRRSSCNALRQQYWTPVWQYMAADPVDTRGGDAFFQALSPVALDVYDQALAKRQQQAERIAHAQAQHLERLRYAAASWARQCRHVDPAHRHGAAEVEHAWAVALAARKQAETAQQQRAQSGPPPAKALSPTLQAAFRALGHKLPELGPPEVRSQAQRQALRRWLIDKVVIQRARRAQMHTRLVWRGGETTPCEVPVAVGALTDLPTAPEMAQHIRGLFAASHTDDEIARQLTQHGYRSPRRPVVLPSTVKGIRIARNRPPDGYQGP
jgi:hypothetical protein